MDPLIKKKLIVPFIIFLLILVIDINSIISGIAQHNILRVIVGAIATAIIVTCFVFLYRSAKNGGGNNDNDLTE